MVVGHVHGGVVVQHGVMVCLHQVWCLEIIIHNHSTGTLQLLLISSSRSIIKNIYRVVFISLGTYLVIYQLICRGLGYLPCTFFFCCLPVADDDDDDRQNNESTEDANGDDGTDVHMTGILPVERATLPFILGNSFRVEDASEAD